MNTLKNILIINSSPKINGNTQYMIDFFKKNVVANIKEIRLFPSLKNEKGILPCLDCGGCIKKEGCIIEDCFKDIIEDVYDIVVFAAPIYMSNLPGPAFNLISRFNFIYNNRLHLNVKKEFKNKKGIVFLVGGGEASKKLMGESNEDLPIKQIKYIFNKMNVLFNEDHVIKCLNTDEISTKENKMIEKEIIRIIKGI